MSAVHPYPIEVLLLPGGLIFLGTMFVSWKATGSPEFTLLASLAKAGIYLLYFGLIFDGTYTFSDDMIYMEGGIDLLKNDVGITNLDENLEYVLYIALGNHFVYYLYNAYAFKFFGDGYYAPVALNVLLTLPVAYIGFRIAVREFGIKHSKLFFAFLLFHPDILAWSNVMNGKDVVVLFLHVLLLSAASWFFAERFRRAFIVAAPAVAGLFFLRFYVPMLFAGALVIRLLPYWNSKKRLPYFLFAGVLVGCAIAAIGPEVFMRSVDQINEHLTNPAYGAVKIVLTPVPFSTDPIYGFLDIPALIHWALLPFALVGLRHVWRYRTMFSRFIVIYFVVFMALYAMFDELQGPRHRVQLDYAIALFQFVGLLAFFRGRKVFHENTAPFHAPL